MKWATRAASHRCEELTPREDEPDDVGQVGLTTIWLDPQLWRACPIHVAWLRTGRIAENTGLAMNDSPLIHDEVDG